MNTLVNKFINGQYIYTTVLLMNNSTYVKFSVEIEKFYNYQYSKKHMRTKNHQKNIDKIIATLHKNRLIHQAISKWRMNTKAKKI